jgi:hypothetical protein
MTPPTTTGGREENAAGAGMMRTIHLIQKLHEDSLHFSISACLRIKPCCGNRIHLIYENDRWGVFLGQSEHIANHAWPFTEVLLHEFTSNDSDECCGGVVCDSFGKHRLASAWGTIQQYSSRWVYTNLHGHVAC